MTTALETPSRVVAGERSLKFYWVLAGTQDDGEVVAVLSVLHSKAAKAFTAQIYQAVVEYRPGSWTSEMVSMFDPVTGFVRLTSKPVARYSEKALKEFAEEALAALKVAADSVTVTDRFTPQAVMV